MMEPTRPRGPLPAGRDADAEWIDQMVATRLFGAMPRKIGRYTIVETVGSGGMGLVYRAEDTQLERTVAVKLLNADWSTPDGARRLHREARAMARLSHPHVVQVYEVGQYHEQVFLAMEYVEGETLESWLRREHRSDAVRAVFASIGEGIAAAHDVGLIHRDLKPANILLDAAARPKVADFGLARAESLLESELAPTLSDSPPGGSTSVTGSLIGTPRYMAPEQHAGAPASVRSDQFSFCMMLWEALCGAPAFHAPPGGHPVDWTLRAPPRRARLAARVRKTLARGLDPDPALRWSSMRELLAELGRPSWLRRHPRLSWVTSIALLATIAALCYELAFQAPAPAPIPCDPERSAILEYTRAQESRWHAALAVRPYSPQLRGFLAAMIEDWSDETMQLCHDHDSRPERGSELLRQGACLRLGADLLDVWVTDVGTLHPGLQLDARGDVRVELSRPARWAAETLQRTCLLTADEARDMWIRGSASPRTEVTRRLTRTRAMLHLGHPLEALALLRELRPHFTADATPASIHLLTARALRATGAGHEDVLAALYAAEDAAEIQRDDLALLDARLEQAQTALDDLRQRSQWHQSGPAPLLDPRWDRVLDTAAALLRRRGGAIDDDTLRHSWLRAAYAAEHGRAREAAYLRAETLMLARDHASPRLLSELLAEQAGIFDADSEHDATLAARAAEHDLQALAAAPDDDELLGYLHHTAGARAFARGDLEAGRDHMHRARDRYARAFGPGSKQVAEIAYITGQALHAAGESLAALPEADAAVAGQRGHPFPLAFSLYLRSAIHQRTGDTASAVADANAAISALRSAPTNRDTAMWRTILNTALVEALVAHGALPEALALADAVQRELDAAPDMDIGGQSDELRLARAKAWMRLGRPLAARAALSRAREPSFLEYDLYKRAEALTLLAGLLDATPDPAAQLAREAADLFARLGSDGHDQRTLSTYPR